jgi:hypothetical protein
LSTTGYKSHYKSPKNPNWPTGTLVVNVMLVAKQHCIASTGRVDKPMKTNTTRNVTSVVMLVLLTPFLALAMLVSIQTAGIRDNEILLLLLTLSSAVLSGVNGFGRRTSTAVPLSTVQASGERSSRARIHLSARSSNNA